VADNWTDNPLPGAPGVVFDSVPAYGSEDDLRGHVTGVDPTRYRLAVFIYVGEWWTKPTFAQPLTPLGLDGTWVCDVTTGVNDVLATRIAAFLVPVGYSPPLLSGAATLPPELGDNAIASLEVPRGP